jgi:hypothetical protein
MKIAFYDHVQPTSSEPEKIGPLAMKALNVADWVDLSKKTGDVHKKICGTDWKLAFLHLSDNITWNKLLSDSCLATRIIVRVSTNGLCAGPLRSRSPLLLEIVPKLDQVGAGELELIANELADSKKLEMLKENLVPTELRRYFQLVRPDHLAAFFIAGLASLVAALNSPDHDARFALASDKSPADEKKPSLRQEADKWLRGMGYVPCASLDSRADTDGLVERSLAPFNEIPNLRKTFTRECGGTILPELNELLSGDTLKSRRDEAALLAALKSLSKELHVEP